MRILHTADWHLGHRLYDRDRTNEHRAALAWLLDTIETEKVDLLIVAGDVFDVTNPSNQARELYYDFLGQLARTSCQGAVIVGGNHDSPAMLDAPRDVLKFLNLHVIGSARPQVQGEVIQIDTQDESVIVAAVPYLRERDIRKSRFGETSAERLADLQTGIRTHYEAVAAAATELRTNPTTPIIATGHLFAGGASDHPEKKSYIYQADEHNIEGAHFPAVFDYVALGHIHRAQRVGGQEHIRYSGSLIPLTFVEGQLPRSVQIVDLKKAGEPIETRKIEVPYFRRLIRLHDELPAVEQALINEVITYQNTSAASSQQRQPPPQAAAKRIANQVSPIANRQSLTPWAEVRVKTNTPIPNLNLHLEEVVRKATDPQKITPALEFARRSQEKLNPAPAAAPVAKIRLSELDPEEVFTGICHGEGYPPERTAELLADFRTLRNWYVEEKANA
ncbi:MAG: exonuclease subunit SbcD [Bacteroidota bacterium]